MIEKISGRVAYAVMSFGGFLGMGTEEHAIPWNKLTYDTRLGGYRTDITEALQPFRAIEITTDGSQWRTRAARHYVPHTTGDPRSPEQELALGSVRWIAPAWHQHG